MSLGDFSQFAYLYDALTTKYPGLTGSTDGTSVFQFATSPQSASWQTGTDANAYGVANAVPTDLTGFYTPGDALDSAYQDLISSIQPANYADNPAYSQAQTVLSGLQGQFAQAASAANSAYYVWLANNTNKDGTPAATKAAWLVDPMGGQSYGDQLASIQTQITNETAKVAAIVSAMDGALSRAQKAASTDTMPISHGGPAIQVPTVSISGDLAGDLARWAQYPDGTNDFTAIVEQSTQIKSPWKTIYSSATTVDCWGASADVSVNTSRIIQDVNYKLEVTIKGLNTYKITRGAWYDPDYVNPKVKIVPGATVTNDTFFGPRGSLHLIPETIFVMYRPTFKLTISTETYKQQFEANSDVAIEWIDLFGSRFSFSGLASLQPVDNGDNTTTVTFASPATAQPQILGVVSKVAYNGSTPAPAAALHSRIATNAALVVAGIGPQEHNNFPSSPVARAIQVRRHLPFGGAPFVVYDTNTGATLGAGDCPALTAHPNFIAVSIPVNVPFTVQNLSPTVAIEVTW